MPNEVNIRMSVDALHLIIQALQDSVALRQQNTAVLVSQLQQSLNAVMVPVPPPSPVIPAV